MTVKLSVEIPDIAIRQGGEAISEDGYMLDELGNYLTDENGDRLIYG